LERLYGADPARMTLVPCGFDADEFSPRSRQLARRRLGIPADEFMVLQLGRMVPRKGVETVVRAMALLPPELPARLRVVGGECDEPDERRTPEIGRLRAAARACGVDDRVVFEGRKPRAELHRWYAAADVFVTTPWYEPFGITPLEAMACARPVVGSAVGGVRYSVVDGTTGLLVPPRDEAALAAALRRLHDEPARARAMGEAGLARVRELFTWECVAQALARVFREVAGAIVVPEVAAMARPARRRAVAPLFHVMGMDPPPPARRAAGARAIFLDKDGTLVEDVPYNVDPARLRFTPGALEALRLWRDAGFQLVVVTNQSGLGRGLFGRAELEALQRALAGRLAEAGIPLAGFHACPHAPAVAPARGCACRKPAPGLLLAAARAHGIDLARSWMVGDILNDVEAGHLAGCRSVLLDVGNETEWRAGPLREPDLRCPDLLAAARATLRESARPGRRDAPQAMQGAA
jgi:histidinol-phosphate phosphatase family protein